MDGKIRTAEEQTKKKRKHGLLKTGGTLLKCMLYVDFDDLHLFFQTCFFSKRVGGGVDVWNVQRRDENLTDCKIVRLG